MPISGTKIACCQFESCPLIGLVFPHRRARLKRNSAHISTATATICTHAISGSPPIESLSSSRCKGGLSTDEMFEVWLRWFLPKQTRPQRASPPVGVAAAMDTTDTARCAVVGLPLALGVVRPLRPPGSQLKSYGDRGGL